MPHIRGKTARRQISVVSSGAAGSSKVRYVIPGVACPNCRSEMRHDPKTRIHSCRKCKRRFTAQEVKEHLIALAEASKREGERMREWHREQLNEERRRKAMEKHIRENGKTGVVYYLRFRDSLKIGTSTNVEKRVKAHPYEELVAVEPGGPTLESRRHKEFREFRLDREWFEYTEKAQRMVERIRWESSDWFEFVFDQCPPLPARKDEIVWPPIGNYPGIG